MLSRIKAIQKTSLIDYPNKVSCVIFLGGCNFRCGYCHNPDLIKDDLKSLDEEEVLEFLKKRKKWLDGVVFSGGEPLLKNDIISFIEKVKEVGYMIKIDTNGTNPELLKSLIDKKLIDYVAMDLKNRLNKYEEVVNTKVDINKVKKSIDIIKNSKISHEFRCTVLPRLHSKEDIKEMTNLIKNDTLFLQQFNNKVKLLDPKFENDVPFSVSELEEIKKACEKSIRKIEIRA